jgi:nudix-type nucleoside diphosphatase (YffH/AdpP family)
VTVLFFYGTLRHMPLLRQVLGRKVEVEPAVLPGHAVLRAAAGDWPTLVPLAGALASGALMRDVTESDLERLDFYEGGFGYRLAAQSVHSSDGTTLTALVYMPPEAQRSAGDWSLDDWCRDWGDVAVATAADMMMLMGQRSGAEVARRYGLMQVRGASRLRAATASPATRRHHADDSDVQILRHRQSYANFFALEEYDLTYRRFDGSRSPVINRAVFVSGDAVTVLPYDPARDRVLLIEQFRAGPMGRGDPQPWLLEAIAGRIDAGETPEQAARREAVEEAGLALGALEFVAGYYPSPGAKSEYIYSYVALTDLPDGIEGVFGVEGEAEDIRGHLVSCETFMSLVESGEVNNAPLMLTAFWLQRERTRLRALRHGDSDNTSV